MTDKAGVLDVRASYRCCYLLTYYPRRGLKFDLGPDNTTALGFLLFCQNGDPHAHNLLNFNAAPVNPTALRMWFITGQVNYHLTARPYTTHVGVYFLSSKYFFFKNVSNT